MTTHTDTTGRIHTIHTDDSITIIVTRSAGKDGAVLVMVDTEGWEPVGLDGGPGLRVLVNDEPVYAGLNHQPWPDGKVREAPAQRFTVQLTDLMYTGDPA